MTTPAFRRCSGTTLPGWCDDPSADPPHHRPRRPLPHRARARPGRHGHGLSRPGPEAHRQVAIKVLRPELPPSLGAERFLREIKIDRDAAASAHPAAASIRARPTGFLFYVMPFIEGESLRDRLDREKQLPVDDAVRIASEVADALDYAHDTASSTGTSSPRTSCSRDGRPWSPISASPARSRRGRRAHDRDRHRHRHARLHESPAGHRRAKLTARTDSIRSPAFLRNAGGRAAVHRPDRRGHHRQAPRRAHAGGAGRPGRRYRKGSTGALQKALQRARADRFATVTEFASALQATATPARRRTRHRGVIVAMLLGAHRAWSRGVVDRRQAPGGCRPESRHHRGAAVSRRRRRRGRLSPRVDARSAERATHGGRRHPDGRAPHDTQRLATCGRGREGGPVGRSIPPAGRRARRRSRAARERHCDADRADAERHPPSRVRRPCRGHGVSRRSGRQRGRARASTVSRRAC